MNKFSALSKAKLAEQCLSELLRRGKAGLSPIDVNIRALTHASFLDGAGKFGNIAFPTDMNIFCIRHGIRIVSQSTPFTSVRGCKAIFKRYWLAELDAAKSAVSVLNSWRAKWGVRPLSKCSRDALLAAFQSRATIFGGGVL